jgi:hypothetical protein
VPGDEDDPRRQKLLGCRHPLLGVAIVIDGEQLDLLAEHASALVEHRHGHLGAALLLLPEPGHGAGQGAGAADPYLGAGRGGGERYGGNHADKKRCADHQPILSHYLCITMSR